MNIFIMILIIWFSICIMYLYLKNKKQLKRNNSSNKVLSAKMVSEDSLSEILVEKLEADFNVAVDNLTPIKDDSIISKISASIPLVAQLTERALTGDVYKVIIPSGAELTKSLSMNGAVRGFYKGSKGISGHANLIKANFNVSDVMAVVSFIVGQYYMTEIDTKLQTLSIDIKKISDFHEREFKSQISSLISRIDKITKFSSEIINSDEIRVQKLQALENIEADAIQLLNQVNIEFDEIVNSFDGINLQSYQEAVKNISKLSKYQYILIEMIEKECEMTYLFGKGKISNELAYEILNKYTTQTNLIRDKLPKWHEYHIKNLKIQVEKNRSAKEGLEGVLSKIPGVFDDKWNYVPLQAKIQTAIEKQLNDNNLSYKMIGNVYENNIQILIKDGQYYYNHYTE